MRRQVARATRRAAKPGKQQAATNAPSRPNLRGKAQSNRYPGCWMSQAGGGGGVLEAQRTKLVRSVVHHRHLHPMAVPPCLDVCLSLWEGCHSPLTWPGAPCSWVIMMWSWSLSGASTAWPDCRAAVRRQKDAP